METTPLRRNRDFTLLMGGATVSAVGTAMTSLAFLMLAWTTTGSSALAGLVGAVVGVGELVATLPAGALCDRWDRKRTMVATSLAQAALFATVPLAAQLGHLTYAHLLVVAFVSGMLSCFFGPAERGALKKVVPPQQMGAAMSTTMARSSLGSLLGPSLSGALYGISRTLPLTGNAISYLFAALGAGLVRTPLPAPERDEKTHVVDDIRQGLSWLWRTVAVRDITLVALVMNLGINGLVTVAVLALQRSGTPAHALGLMEAATGVAGLAGAVLAPVLLARMRVGTATLACMLVVVVLCCALPLGTSVWWIGGLLCLVVVVIMPLNSGIGAYAMHVTPDAMQGRSGAAGSFASTAMVPAGTASAGFLLEHFGRPASMLAFAAILAVAGVGALFSRPIRTIPRTAEFASVASAG